MPATTADLLATAQPRQVLVPVCARPDLVDERDHLRERLAAGIDLPAQQRLDQVEADIAAHTVTYTVTGIGARSWVELRRAHPGTAAHRRATGVDWNPDTFPHAAIAACTDGLSDVDAHALYETLPFGEWLKLWDAVLVANLTALEVSTEAATAALTASAGADG